MHTQNHPFFKNFLLFYLVVSNKVHTFATSNKKNDKQNKKVTLLGGFKLSYI